MRYLSVFQAPFYPAEAERKGLSASEYGFVFGIYELTVFVVSPIIGANLEWLGGIKVSPRFGRCELRDVNAADSSRWLGCVRICDGSRRVYREIFSITYHYSKTASTCSGNT